MTKCKDCTKLEFEIQRLENQIEMCRKEFEGSKLQKLYKIIDEKNEDIKRCRERIEELANLVDSKVLSEHDNKKYGGGVK